MAVRFLECGFEESTGRVDLSPIVQLWILRLLVPLGTHQEFLRDHGFRSDAVAESLGLGRWLHDEQLDWNRRLVLSELRRCHLKAERNAHKAKAPDCLSGNMAQVADMVGLTATDRKVLEFAILINTEKLLDDTADLLGELSSIKVFHALSGVLNVPEHEVRKSLGSDGVLGRSGLLVVDRDGQYPLRSKLNLLSHSFADVMYSVKSDPITLLRETVSMSGPAQLDFSDYHHVDDTLAVLRPYLQNAVETGRKGVNIFIHGAPGTGKSQLAKVFAKDLGCELFEVASEDDDGDPVDGSRRLRAYRAAQSFFAQRRALILFDEVEDVFNDGNDLFGQRSTAQSRKAWINRALEENTIPTLWLSNIIHGLDPAFIRRFDMVFELSIPPKRQRERILTQECGDLLDSASLSRIAESESLAPAVVAKAASVVRSIREQLGEQQSAMAFELLIGSTLEAQGHKPIKKGDPNRLPDVYDPKFINADADLTSVAAGLKQPKSGRLCLYGPPGTGKTAYARWLAEQLEMPLIVKRASDLISMYVGGTEKCIARAFREAEQEGAVLLVDEVDSFLQDRRGAQHSWEVTEVNEMLTQIESFSGVFIATTNLMQGLDQAALRRFDLKAKFDFLTPEQASELLRRYCEKMNLQPPERSNFAKITHLRNLTPGDFAAVTRQSRFRPRLSGTEIVEALEAECALKEGAKSGMGFIA